MKDKESSSSNDDFPSEKDKILNSRNQFLRTFTLDSSNPTISPPISPDYLRTLSGRSTSALGSLTNSNSNNPLTSISKIKSNFQKSRTIEEYTNIIKNPYSPVRTKMNYYHKLRQSSILSSPIKLDPNLKLLSRLNWRIPDQPYRVLEAPGLSNNFYTNVLAWSEHGVFLAIDNSLHRYVPITKHSSRFLKLSSIGCVRDLSSDTATNSTATQLGGLNTKSIYKLQADEIITSVSNCIYDKNKLGIATSGGSIVLLDLIKETPYLGYRSHVGRVGCLSFGSDSILASGGQDHRINVFDHRSKPPSLNYYRVNLTTINYHKGEITGLKFSPDGRMIASGGNDNEFAVWDPAMVQNNKKIAPVLSYKNMRSAVRALDWSKQSRGLIVIGGGVYDKKLRVIDVVRNNEPLFEVDTGSQICSVAWSSWRNQIISAHGFCENEVNVWDYPSMKKVGRMNGHKCRVLYLTMNPDDTQFITGSSDETIKFWNLGNETGNESAYRNIRDGVHE
eukprot:GAHX01001358.1.p1 GENE.GAHX01001358.1~~GAHX01001358.1.p1  ORF type:complete len:505 (+),score=75.87 GAHX01001358.1:116-1630(+)